MKRISAAIILASASVCLPAQTLTEIGRQLESLGCYADSATYEVFLPNLSEPVAYSIKLESLSALSDSLSPCRYFIGWQLPAPSGISEGFMAYFNGTHYRMRDERLQEYHHEWNPEVFAPGGDASRGIQNQAQFADLLPQALGRHFIEMAADSSYIFTVSRKTSGGKDCIEIDGRRRLSGYDAAEYTYILDAATLLPMSIEFDNNPGQLGEQNITVRYGSPEPCADMRIDEESVVARRPDDFGKYRESTFSLQSLPGRELPRIVSRTSTGERYEHEKGAPFAAPTIIVFADATVGSTAGLVADVRTAVDMLPLQTDVVWAFINHRADDVEGAVPSVRPGEHLLVGARGAARDCGVGAVTPVLIFASADGKVSDIAVGYNKDMTSLVIQKITNAK